MNNDFDTSNCPLCGEIYEASYRKHARIYYRCPWCQCEWFAVDENYAPEPPEEKKG